MSNDKMRAEFEKWYLNEYFEGDRVCGLEWLSTEPCGGYRYERPSTHWKVWQASRAAIVVEIPPSPEVPEDPEDAIDDSHMDAYHSAVKMREGCSKAITAAGLKVKP